MQIIGTFDILMLAMRSATPADIPSTSSIMSTVLLESFDLKLTTIDLTRCTLWIHKLHVMIAKHQPIHVHAEGLIDYKFLDRNCIASFNSFSNFAINFS